MEITFKVHCWKWCLFLFVKLVFTFQIGNCGHFLPQKWALNILISIDLNQEYSSGYSSYVINILAHVLMEGQLNILKSWSFDDLVNWLILKVGTAVVTRTDGRLALGRLGALCEQVCCLFYTLLRLELWEFALIALFSF